MTVGDRARGMLTRIIPMAVEVFISLGAALLAVGLLAWAIAGFPPVSLGPPANFSG